LRTFVGSVHFRLRFAAVTGAQNSWVWVLNTCRDLDTGCNCAGRPFGRLTAGAQRWRGRSLAGPRGLSQFSRSRNWGLTPSVI
jgi:hypothetical protein